MPQGSKRQTSHPNVHKAPGQSQLRKTDTSTLERNDPTRTCLVERPDHKARHGALDRKMPKGSKQKMGHSNVHKALVQSELSKTDTGTLERNGLT